MKLSKLYSNQPIKFVDINFNDSLNIIMAEIRLPENCHKDTHNLGKTTVGKIIDFCLLSKRKPDLFLFKHLEIFKNFIFFLEIKTFNEEYLTIKRSVADNTKISFKKSLYSNQNFSLLDDSEWDYCQIALNDTKNNAKKILDGLLDVCAFNPWDFRKGLGYLLRSQTDYTEVFKLNKFRGTDENWKPFLANILGFNVDLINKHYKKEDEIKDIKLKIARIKKESSISIEDNSKIEGILSIKQKEIIDKQNILDAFDFQLVDELKTKEIIDNIDIDIANLNLKRYSLNLSRKKILSFITEEKVLFNLDEAEQLFNEVGVLFQGQIKKDFKQLIIFNRAITEERYKYLLEEKQDIEIELKQINSKLYMLQKSRSEKLSFLSSTDVFIKYKQISDELVALKSDIIVLIRQRESIERLKELRNEVDKLSKEKEYLFEQINIDINEKVFSENNSSLFSIIRSDFAEIIKRVIDETAILSVSLNKYNHLEFKAEILDKLGNSTSADKGTSYKKLLCIAFDMALLRANLTAKFPRFVFHDGVLEGLDHRKKENLLAVIRRYADLGVQQIVTLIDSDLPPLTLLEYTNQGIYTEEIILRLHDENESGRLFKMKAY